MGLWFPGQDFNSAPKKCWCCRSHRGRLDGQDCSWTAGGVRGAGAPPGQLQVQEGREVFFVLPERFLRGKFICHPDSRILKVGVFFSVLRSAQLVAADRICSQLAGLSPEVLSLGSLMTEMKGCRRWFHRHPPNLGSQSGSQRWSGREQLCALPLQHLPRSSPPKKAQKFVSPFQDSVEIFQQHCRTLKKSQFSLNKCLFSLLCSLHWEVVRETQRAGFAAQVGGGEKHKEKYEEIRQSFFLCTDCFSRSIEIQLVVLQCDRCW